MNSHGESSTDTNRESQRLFEEVLPHLLRKPKSKWTKTELGQAIELHFKRPMRGLINQGPDDSRYYRALEAKLKGEPVDPDYPPPPPKKRGRPQKYSRETYLMHWESVQELRKQIATERGVAIDKVRDKEVATRLALRSFANRGVKAPAYEIRELAKRFETRCKALNKKRNQEKYKSR